MAPMTDFEEQTEATNRIMNAEITGRGLLLIRIICYNQTIYNDMRLEVAEYTGLGLVPDNRLSTVLTEVEPMYNESSILIIDDDSKLHITITFLLGGSLPKLICILCLCVLPHTSTRLHMHEIHMNSLTCPISSSPCHACIYFSIVLSVHW